MTANTKILELGKHKLIARNTLTHIEQQTLFCLKVALTPAPCPACHTMVNQVQASGLPLDDYPAGDTRGIKYHCTGCRRELVDIVPFIGPVYFWRLAEPILNSSETADAV